MNTDHIDRIFLTERTPESKAQYFKDRWQEAFLKTLALERENLQLKNELAQFRRCK